MISLGFHTVLVLFAAQIDFIDGLLNLIFGAFGLFFVLFIAIFVGVFVFAFYMICKSIRAASSQMDLVQTATEETTSRTDSRLIRESLPQECPTCDAPLKYNEVQWTGPRQAECPYCGTVVELEETIVGDT